MKVELITTQAEDKRVEQVLVDALEEAFQAGLDNDRGALPDEGQLWERIADLIGVSI